jgi:hypothetical protein
MSKKNLLALVGVVGLLATASLLAGLRHALRRDRPEAELDPREAERKRIREALGDVVRPMDLNDWPERMRPRPGLPDRDTLRAMVPKTDRPAWQILREDRDTR